jgi:hypothetical protein
VVPRKSLLGRETSRQRRRWSFVACANDRTHPGRCDGACERTFLTRSPCCFYATLAFVARLYRHHWAGVRVSIPIAA